MSIKEDVEKIILLEKWGIAERKQWRSELDFWSGEMGDKIKDRISAEKVRRADQYLEREEYFEAAGKKLARLKELLREVISAVDPAYIDSILGDQEAVIMIGLRGIFDWKWEIGLEIGKVNSDATRAQLRPGYRVRETRYKGVDGRRIKWRKFEDEQSLVKYLVAKIAKNVGRYLYRVNQQRKDNPLRSV
jgi:hypothetical protein